MTNGQIKIHLRFIFEGIPLFRRHVISFNAAVCFLFSVNTFNVITFTP